MSGDEFGIEDVAHEIVAGQCAIVAALVIALHENGVLPQEKYSDALHRLWAAMPEDEAIGEAGAVIERVLDILDGRDCPAGPPGARKQERDIANYAGRPVNDDAVARPVPISFWALLHAFRGPARRA